MIVVVSSGGDYTNEFGTAYNFVESYLRAIFGFVGITDISVIHAHGMDVAPAARNAGQKSAIEEARLLARSGGWRPQRNGADPGLVSPEPTPGVVDSVSELMPQVLVA